MLGPYGRNLAMTKGNLAHRIADEVNHTELETKAIVKKTFDAIIKVLVEEGRSAMDSLPLFAKPRLRGGLLAGSAYP
jgi:hypothetical protein